MKHIKFSMNIAFYKQNNQSWVNLENSKQLSLADVRSTSCHYFNNSADYFYGLARD